MCIYITFVLRIVIYVFKTKIYILLYKELSNYYYFVPGYYNNHVSQIQETGRYSLPI